MFITHDTIRWKKNRRKIELNEPERVEIRQAVHLPVDEVYKAIF